MASIELMARCFYLLLKFSNLSLLVCPVRINMKASHESSISDIKLLFYMFYKDNLTTGKSLHKLWSELLFVGL